MPALYYIEVSMKKVAILDTGVGASVDDFSRLHVKKKFGFYKR